MANIGELPHSELEQVPITERDVVGQLVQGMPEGSWMIETDWAKSQYYTHEKHLRNSPKARERFFPDYQRKRKPEVVSAKTMVVGLYPDRRQREVIAHGLFSMLELERYNAEQVKQSLGGRPSDVVGHEMVNLLETTGVIKGRVSLILDSSHLKKFATIELSPGLISSLSRSGGIVAYPLGTGFHYFCARGEHFLASYKKLIGNLGVHSNL